MLVLKSNLCKMCPHRQWYPYIHDGFPDEEEFHWASWHWCPKRQDYIHDSMGCTERRIELKFKRTPLAVRIGIVNEQGEYLVWQK